MTDADEFGSFVRTHTRELQRTAWLLTGDWHSAQDLVQTALVSSWRRWDTITDAPVAYVRRVLLTTYLRGRRRRWTGEIATGELPEQVPDHLLHPDDQETWIGRWGPVATPLLWSHGMYLILADELGLLTQGSTR